MLGAPCVLGTGVAEAEEASELFIRKPRVKELFSIDRITET